MKLNFILLNEFKDEMNTTRKFLASISEDIFEYTPAEKSKTLGQLVNHLLPIASWVPAITEYAELDWSKATPPVVQKTKAAILKQFEVNVAIGAKALETTSNDQLMSPWVMRNGSTIIFSGSKETGIRRYVLNHMIHHRAQLGIYLRLNNIDVPASYVASASEKLY